MKILHLVFLCFVCFAKSHGQTVSKYHAGQIQVEITKERHPKRIDAKVEITHTFPGGDSSLIKSLEKNINKSLPFRNGAKKGVYIVSVKFIISKDGQVSDVQCDKDPGFGMGDEVVKVVKNISRWKPARPDGIQVSEYRH